MEATLNIKDFLNLLVSSHLEKLNKFQWWRTSLLTLSIGTCCVFLIAFRVSWDRCEVAFGQAVILGCAYGHITRGRHDALRSCKRTVNTYCSPSVEGEMQR